jgi:GT2 family glycosyltransferase
VRVLRASVDARGNGEPIAFGTADEWRILLKLGPFPLRQLRVPDPGEVSQELADALVLRQADAALAYEATVARLRARLGASEAQPPARPALSVIVCTHRRSRYLPDVLRALSELDPAPDEVVVVDNDPGEHDSRAVVEAAGAVYVREDARGLDNARNAGVRAARGEILAFTDDDCVPARTWLASAADHFADPLVGAVTGPAFAYAFDTPAQRRFEDSGGFGRGLTRRTFDWRMGVAVGASQAGAGANMLLRRAALGPVPEPFPAELDAGTPTESGGDMYALYKILRGGWRIVYDPATYVHHQHRESWEAMHRAFYGYGVGLAAALTRLLLEERDFGTFRAWRWLVRQYGQALIRRATGEKDALDVRIAWDYLRGGLRGPLEWRRAVRATARAAPPLVPLEPAPEAARGGSSGGERVSVIVPTADRPDTLRRCLEALGRQTVGGFETIVVDDRGGADPAGGNVSRLLRSERVGAAAARNLGAAEASRDILLFLDDDLVPKPDLIERHLEAHGERPGGIVVGHSAPRTRSRNLVSRGSAVWWEDDFRDRADAITTTFVDLFSGNMSIERETFTRLGGFDRGFGQLRREDWEFGVRALEAGLRIEYEPSAWADHELTLTVETVLRAAQLEGEGDALLAERHPRTRPTLRRPPYRRRRLVAMKLLRAGGAPAQGLVVAVLAGLERLGALRWWSRLFSVAHDSAYARGRRRRTESRGRAEPALRIDVASDEPIAVPEVAVPEIELVHGSRRLGRFVPYGGRWTRALADTIAALVPLELLDRPPAAAPLAAATGVTTVRWPGTPEAAEAAIRAAPTDLFALVLDDMPGSDWAREAVAVVAAPKVDAALGARLPAGHPPPAPALRTRATERRPYRLYGPPPRYIVARKDSFEAVGRFGPRVAGLGPQAAMLELVDRLLDRGGTVAYVDLPGLSAPSGRAGRAAAELVRSRDRAALLWRVGRERGGASGAAWVAGRGLLPALARPFTTGPGARRRALALAELGAFLSAAPSARRHGRPARTSPGGRAPLRLRGRLR